MLTKKEIKTLKNEIVLNSLFLKDYSNSLYIKNKTVYSFFDSYIENLYDIAENDGFINHDIYDILEKYDNIDVLYNYYLSLCIDGYDPLCKDDYIAYFNNSVFSGLVIYSINDFYVVVASYGLLGVNNSFNNDKLTINRLHYSVKKDDYYFIKNHRRYYINDFMKTNY